MVRIIDANNSKLSGQDNIPPIGGSGLQHNLEWLISY